MSAGPEIAAVVGGASGGLECRKFRAWRPTTSSARCGVSPAPWARCGTCLPTVRRCRAGGRLCISRSTSWTRVTRSVWAPRWRCSPRAGCRTRCAGRCASPNRSPKPGMPSRPPVTWTAPAAGRSSGRARGRHHLRLAGQRQQAAAAPAQLAAPAGLLRQPPLGDGTRRAEPAVGTATPPGDVRGATSPQYLHRRRPRSAGRPAVAAPERDWISVAACFRCVRQRSPPRDGLH